MNYILSTRGPHADLLANYLANQGWIIASVKQINHFKGEIAGYYVGDAMQFLASGINTGDYIKAIEPAYSA